MKYRHIILTYSIYVIFAESTFFYLVVCMRVPKGWHICFFTLCCFVKDGVPVISWLMIPNLDLLYFLYRFIIIKRRRLQKCNSISFIWHFLRHLGMRVKYFWSSSLFVSKHIHYYCIYFFYFDSLAIIRNMFK